MASRTYPNDYFAWFNDDQRLAILCLDTTSTDSSERTTEKYDTFQGDGNLSGNITATSTSAGSSVIITSASHGLTYSSSKADRVSISGTTSYDGNYTITAASTDTFTISATNSTSNEGASSGVTWASLFVDNGLRITYHSKYELVTLASLTSELSTTNGVDTGLQECIVYNLKARMYEDMGDLQKAQYYRIMYEKELKQYPSRKSGVRVLAVPRM